MTWSILDTTNRGDHLTSLAFLDPNGGTTIQRFESVKYAAFDRLTETSLSFFWRPQEIDLTKDRTDFKTLTDSEKHIFTANIRRQIVLDSVQGKSPNIALLPLVSIPELEAWITAWSFSESIHSRSYTHIIRNVYSNPSVVFDGILDIQEIVDCATDITVYYDRLIELAGWYRLLGEGTHTVNGKIVEVSLYELKKALWMTIMSVNILEGIRFYVSFAAAFSFAENKKMEGNAKTIKLICRDENLHLASTQMLLNLLPKDDPDYVRIAAETHDASIQLFRDAVRQEQEWAKFLFKDGSIIGLNYEILAEYIEWLANKRMFAVGLPAQYKTSSDPLPWMKKWISGSDVQVAPQETEISSYTVSSTKQDVDKNTFSGFSL